MPSQLDQLVERFAGRLDEYTHPSYSEAQVRIDFLNPFFALLGWDVTNVADLSSSEREVVTEPRQRLTDGGIEFPDYLFRAAGSSVFSAEAKKPAVNLRDNPAPALQLRRYVWNSKAMGIGLLTDFQEFCVYDCRIPPSSNDQATKARVEYYTYDQYRDVWSDIEAKFSRTAVLDGALDEYVASLSGTRGKQRVDRLFLAELDAWRKDLAVALAKANPLSADELNTAVQLIIDRIVFLRICEDRGLEPYGTLLELTTDKGMYPRLVHYFNRADEKYNSGLFHFKVEKNRSGHDTLTPTLAVPDSVLRGFIKRLYWPDGPYNFAVFPPDVLGHVYEQFLGKVITLDASKRAEVEEKPEVRKAGGVFYTPTEVVRRIVDATLGPVLADTSVEKLQKNGLGICDPSCGSGSFLIEVYQALLDWHLEQYLKDTPRWSRSRPRRIQKDIQGNWRLSTGERKRLLLAHVFGVDIDPQAVEVTKLALLLKVLEGETDANLHEQAELFHERVLPDLSSNIKCGNSLVGNAFHFDSDQLALGDELEAKVNAFDWPAEFSQVAQGRGFDVIVGNPPWLMAGYHVAESMDYLHKNFATATGKFDLYYVFLEQALRLLAPTGRLGMIVPNKFFHTRAAEALRELLLEHCRLEHIEDFGIEKVFEGATNYSCIVHLRAGKPAESFEFTELTADLEASDAFSIERKSLQSKKTWSFQNTQAVEAIEQMRAASVPLHELVARFATGVQTGSDSVLAMTAKQYEDLGLEAGLRRTLLRGRDVRAFDIAESPKVCLFPYRERGGSFHILTPDELAKYPKGMAYLQRHKERLAQRVWFGKSAEELSGRWYGYMYVEALASLQSPHLLTPSLSYGSNFALGDGSLWATGTAGVTGVVPKEGIPWSAEGLTALLNSRPITAFVRATSPAYQGGFRKFSAPYLKDIPLPSGPARSLASLDVELRSLHAEVRRQTASIRQTTRDAERERHTKRREAAVLAIDDAVGKAFNLSRESIAWVRSKTA